MAGGVARIAERDPDDLIETNEIAGRRPRRRRLLG
jgi:hypothetical protein